MTLQTTEHVLMATTKSFKTYTPTEGSTFDVNGHVFRLQPSVPGDILLDFLSMGDDETETTKMASLLRDLFKVAILPEDFDRWTTFIRDPANNVTMTTLSEIAGYVAEVMSGNPTARQPEPLMAG